VTSREELLAFEGVSRSVLQQRITRLVYLLDAARELVEADDMATRTGSAGAYSAEERYEDAWDRLRSALKAV
jgi:hypothetical protein